jgi:hypothetical protein
MAISIASLRRTRNTSPPRVLIYGPEKAGKTTLANEFPAPVFLQTEVGTGNLELDTFGELKTYQDVMDAIGTLYQDPHDFQTVVIDSISKLQPIIWAETGERGDDKGNKKKRIEDFGYGKGYVYALAVWQELMEALDLLRLERGMNVVMIAHAKVERFDDPETVSYSRYQIDLHDKAADLLKRDVDVILLVKPDVAIKSEEGGFNKSRAIATGGRNVWMHTDSRPAFVAGNRYGMPEKLIFKPGEGFAALAPYFPNTATETEQKAA